MNWDAVYFYFLLCLFGACVGSHLNVVIHRLPHKGEYLSSARSKCPACGRVLKLFDLIPILSYLALKGRCRYCGAKISARYLVVEVVTAALAAFSFMRFGFTLGSIVAFGTAAILLAVAIIDRATMEIPTSLCVALVPFAILAVWAFDVPLLQRVIGAFCVSVPMLLLALLIKGAFGGGDIRLMTVCGFLLGFQNVIFAFFTAVLTGGAYAVFLLARRKKARGEHIPFGPHLCFGVVLALFYGSLLTRKYLQLFNLYI